MFHRQSENENTNTSKQTTGRTKLNVIHLFCAAYSVDYINAQKTFKNAHKKLANKKNVCSDNEVN